MALLIIEFVVVFLLSGASVQSIVATLKQGYTSNRHGDAMESMTLSRSIFF